MSSSDGSVLGIATVVDHGDPALRWNLVLLGDGYQASELAKYASDVDAFVEKFKTTSPYDELFAGINVFRIDVTSMRKTLIPAKSSSYGDVVLNFSTNASTSETYFASSLA